MIHPQTELKYVSEQIGCGVFATADIPQGTIVFAKDELDIEITPGQFQAMVPEIQDVVEKYSYIDADGIRVVSWDHAKYVNHSCDCNTMSTGYGFEIAIRDISQGEEITDEYGMFNSSETIPLACQCRACRKFIYPDDLDVYHTMWDRQVQAAVDRLPHVTQPLMPFIPNNMKNMLFGYLRGTEPYRSVYSLKFNGQKDLLAGLCNI